MKTEHTHQLTRSKPSSTVEICSCGKFRFTKNAGPPIVEVSAASVESARASHSEQTGNSRVEFRRFDSHIAIEPYKLTRQTAEEIQAKLNDLAQYEGTHADFDIHDPNGEVAAVYLFQKGGKLYARGGRNTQVLRNPENLWQFLQRNKRIYNITFITDRRLAVQASHDSTTQNQPKKI